MKNTIKTLALALTVLAAGCSKETDLPGGSPAGNNEKIQLGGGITDFNVTLMAVERPFKLYGLTDLDSWSGFHINGVNASLDMDGNIQPSQTHFWPSPTQEVRFVGIMNAGDISTPSTGADASGDITLTAGSTLASDILLSNNLETSKTAPGVKKMDFRHLMAQLQVKVTVESGLSGDCVVAGTIAAGKTSGKYNALWDETAEAASGLSATPYNIAYSVTATNDNASNPDKIYYLVPDGSTVIDKMTGITINGVPVADAVISKALGAEDITLKAGKSYEVTFSVSRRGIETAEISITPWNSSALSQKTAVIDSEAKSLNIEWDAQGAAPVDVELMGTDGKTYIGTVVPDDEEEGKGTIGFASLPAAINAVSVFCGDDKVAVTTAPQDAGEYLWDYETGTSTLEIKLVLVSEPEHLQAANTVTGGLAKHYRQVNNLDLSDYSNWDPIANYDTGEFTGSYDGGSHIVENLVINRTDDGVGFFGRVEYAVLKRIRIESGSVYASRNVGGISGLAYESSVSDCYNKADVTSAGARAGGIAGWLDYGSVTNCSNTGTIISEAGGYAGGICGEAYGYLDPPQAYTIKDCINSGYIEGSYDIGGIAGFSEDILVTGCYNYGDIMCTSAVAGGITGWGTIVEHSVNKGNVTCEGGNAGGITGEGQSVKYCSNYGDVTALTPASYYGGIIGFSATGWDSGVELIHNYNEGAVKGAYERTGGIAGEVFSGDGNSSNIAYCVNKGDVEGISYDIGGILGYNETGGITISYCENYGDVEALNSNSQRIGGIIGFCSASTGNAEIIRNYNEGAVKGVGFFAGGIVGQIRVSNGKNGNISYCVNKGEVEVLEEYGGGIAGITSGDGYSNKLFFGNINSGDIISAGSAGPVGGIVGAVESAASLTACYNTGNINGNIWGTGGIAGRLEDYDGTDRITACYNIGTVTSNEASSTGGIIGDNAYAGMLLDCFWGGASASLPGAGSGSQAGMTKFADFATSGAWPTTSMTGWELTSSNGADGKYWKSLGSWPAGGQPTYPRLWFE